MFSKNLRKKTLFSQRVLAFCYNEDYIFLVI